MAAISKWYRDRTDNLLSIDLDPSFAGTLELNWTDYFASPVTAAAAQTPVAESGGTVTISNIVASDTALIFRAASLGAAGTAATVRFQVSFGSGQTDSITVRLRSRVQ
jgi:hypothetical protein